MCRSWRNANTRSIGMKCSFIWKQISISMPWRKYVTVLPRPTRYELSLIDHVSRQRGKKFFRDFLFCVLYKPIYLPVIWEKYLNSYCVMRIPCNLVYWKIGNFNIVIKRHLKVVHILIYQNIYIKKITKIASILLLSFSSKKSIIQCRKYIHWSAAKSLLINLLNLKTKSGKFTRETIFWRAHCIYYLCFNRSSRQASALHMFEAIVLACLVTFDAVNERVGKSKTFVPLVWQQFLLCLLLPDLCLTIQHCWWRLRL